MQKASFTILSSLIVTLSAFAGFFWGAQWLVRQLHISEFATGFERLIFLCIYVIGTIGGLIMGLFLYPLVLRQISTSEQYWAWVGGQTKAQVPLLSQLLHWWSKVLFGQSQK